jgi:CBS domain-containing protein
MQGGREVFFKMPATGWPGLPVINDKMELTGVITAFDLLKAIRKGISLDDITVDQIVSNTITGFHGVYPWVDVTRSEAEAFRRSRSSEACSPVSSTTGLPVGIYGPAICGYGYPAGNAYRHDDQQ